MASATGTTGRASKVKAGNIEQNLCTSSGSSHSINIYPPQSPTRITNDSILKLAGAFHGLKTSKIRFCAFSYSMGVPCGRSFQVIMYFMIFLLSHFVTICPVAYVGTTAHPCSRWRRGAATLGGRGVCSHAVEGGALV